MLDPTKSIEFGLLLPPDYQWLDAAGPVDYINQHNQTLLKLVGFPDAIVKKAPVINWHYISWLGDLKPIRSTSGPMQTPSTTFKDCPSLDYLLVPGPDPNLELPAETIDFIKTQFVGLKALLTVCTGSLLMAQTGLLDGVEAATNKFALKNLIERGAFEKFKKVKWAIDKRFVVDGKIWTAAGITAGLDLGAEFARVHFDAELVEMIKGLSEFEPKPAQPDPWAKLMAGVAVPK
ncbi:ThiJ/PfpI [Ephemerocybe angulata]|uniref:ThiJ/PfpI n=1 Tax=Ephemerocybe angulata TaxID=980116 RepID=A0A8H6MGX3_9AGAR|nr:ThiJ/PfpI [Tulosesus angulatus]